MPDITWSVKVNDETQERLKTLLEESGFNNKDFFINLLSVYELQRAKETTPTLAADIDELETLTRRINFIFANVSERINTIQKDSTEEQKRQAETNQNTIELLQQRIASLERDRAENEERIQLFISDKEATESKASELRARIKDLEQAATDKQLLIGEYKEKLDAQTSIVAEYRQSAEEVRAIQKENTELTAKNQDTERQLANLTEKMKRQAEQHAVDQERLKDTLAIEREKAILELRTEHQKELQAQQELYNDKVKDLLGRLESLSQTKKTTSKKASTE